MNILLTCAGRRNYLVHYFRRALAGTGQVLCADADPMAPAMCDADTALTVPRVDSAEYVPAVVSACREHSVRLLISLNDLELPVLARARAALALLLAEHRVAPPLDREDRPQLRLDCAVGLRHRRRVRFRLHDEIAGAEAGQRDRVGGVRQAEREIEVRAHGPGSSVDLEVQKRDHARADEQRDEDREEHEAEAVVLAGELGRQHQCPFR